MSLLLHATFEHLAEVLDNAKRLPRSEAILQLRAAAETVDPENAELLRWFLRRAAAVLALDEDGA